MLQRGIPPGSKPRKATIARERRQDLLDEKSAMPCQPAPVLLRPVPVATSKNGNGTLVKAPSSYVIMRSNDSRRFLDRTLHFEAIPGCRLMREVFHVTLCALPPGCLNPGSRIRVLLTGS